MSGDLDKKFEGDTEPDDETLNKEASKMVGNTLS